MSLLWTGACRIYFNAYTEAPLFWSVDNGDSATEIKCPRVVMAGSFETVVVPEQKVQPSVALVPRGQASIGRRMELLL
jgi:hypothetical protein